MDVKERVAELLEESEEDREWERRGDWDYVATLQNNVSIARRIKGPSMQSIVQQKRELAEKVKLRTQMVWALVDDSLRRKGGE